VVGGFDRCGNFTVAIASCLMPARARGIGSP